MIFVGITTLTAGWMNISNIYLPQIIIAKMQIQGMINLVLTGIIMVCVVVVLVDAVPRWKKAVSNQQAAVSGQMIFM
jgi:carbon starvation protein